MSASMNRRELIQIAAAAALSAPMGLAAGTAKFFTPDEFALLDELTEMIVPTDDHSPGARAAGAAAYIDARVAEAFDPHDQENWRNGLRLVDALSKKLHGRVFMAATPEQRHAVLARMAENETHPKTPEEMFFGELKRATAHAYYSSKIGIHQEMEYKGNVLLDEFVGYEAK